MTVETTFSANALLAKTVAALGSAACITAATISAPSTASAQDVVVPAPAPIYTPLAVADATLGAPPGYRAVYYHPSAFYSEPEYPAYPGYPVAYYYDDTYIYAGPAYPGPARVAAAAAADTNWLSYCSSKYRSFDPASGTFLGNDGVRHPCR
jgi:hypothetical protein